MKSSWKQRKMEALAWVNRAAWAIDEARKSLLGLNTEKTTIGPYAPKTQLGQLAVKARNARLKGKRNEPKK